MKKVKYFYNNQTLRYERSEQSIRSYAWKVLGYLSSVMVFAAFIVYISFAYLDSPKEKALKNKISKLQLQYKLMNEDLNQMSAVLSGLEEKDDNVYRMIFEADPIPDAVRQAGIGGNNRYNNIEDFNSSNLVQSTSKKIDKIKRQLYIQSKSYDEVYQMIQEKEKMLSSIPAIQPISNKDLSRMASGYGNRIHPIYKTYKMHWGMDFSSPRGTKIYATGNGKVTLVKNSRNGFGRHVIIDHGFGYKTLYAHMSKIKVRKGQELKRGEVIGLVGSTGTSVAPHLHYEVIKDGRKVNPVNFYYNDLTPAEFDKMLELSSRHGQSFD